MSATLQFDQPSETASSREFEIVFDHYDPQNERRRESLFSLGNGLLHCRSSAPEEAKGEHHYPGLYRAGCYARLRGTIEGEDVSTDSLANLPNWLALSFRLEGEDDWVSLDRAEIVDYEQRLDMKAGLLTRHVRFRDGQGRSTVLREERLVSMSAPHLGALRTVLSPQDWCGRIEIRSGIDGAASNELAAEEGGYEAGAIERLSLEEAAPGGCLLARLRTLGTQVEVAVAVRTQVKSGEESVEGCREVERDGRSIARRWHAHVAEGACVSVEKIAAIYTSRDDAIAAPAGAALAAARDAPNYGGLRADHCRAWQHLWSRCRIEIDDENLARASTLHEFHLLQTASPHASLCDAGLPSRGWQEAYHGQIFWDETMSLSFLSLHLPEVVRSALLYRHRRLGAARRRALALGLEGALYPWRSATVGHEETPEFQENPRSGRWHRDDTRLQFHVGSAIAHNVWRYFLATRDIDFMAGYGAEMIVEIARMWASLAKPHPQRPGRFSIRGVVGPDEFHTRYPGAAEPGLDDNTYTNLTAAWTLSRAIEALGCLPTCHREAVASKVKLRADEQGRWREVASGLHLPVDAQGLFLPFDCYESLTDFDLQTYEKTHPGERIDWSLEAEGKDVNVYKVQKQAEFAMLPYLLSPDELDDLLAGLGMPTCPERMRLTVEADLARTSHDSSLSHLVYAGALARLAPETSWEIFRDALHPDEKAGHSGTEKGVHLGAMAATLDILHRIYLGIRPAEDALVIEPNPPPHLGQIAIHVLFRSNSLEVELDAGRLSLAADPANHAPVPLVVLGSRRFLDPGARVTYPLKDATGSGTGAAWRKA